MEKVNSKNYHIERTIKSPKIEASATKGEILLEGRSYPENAAHFYEPLLKWFDDFVDTRPEAINFVMDMEYFNTSTAGILYEFIEKLFKLPESIAVEVVWRYEEEDEDMSSKGKSLQSHFGERFVLDLRS